MNALVLRWHDECVTFLESVELPEHFLDKDDVICVSFNKSYETSGKFYKMLSSNIYVIQNLKVFENKKNELIAKKNYLLYLLASKYEYL